MRDLAKTSSYGVMHLVVAMGVAYAISGSWQIALGIGLVEPLVQTVFYNLHERGWRRMPAGILRKLDRMQLRRLAPASP